MCVLFVCFLALSLQGVAYSAGQLVGCAVMADQTSFARTDQGGAFSGRASMYTFALRVVPGVDCKDHILEEPLVTTLVTSSECTTISPLSTAAWEVREDEFQG